jgi:hypothetical protein
MLVPPLFRSKGTDCILIPVLEVAKQRSLWKCIKETPQRATVVLSYRPPLDALTQRVIPEIRGAGSGHGNKQGVGAEETRLEYCSHKNRLGHEYLDAISVYVLPAALAAV